MIGYLFERIKYLFVLYIYLFLSLNHVIADQSQDHLEIDLLIMRCYKDTKYCKEALFKINNYQIIAATNKKFSCQTRLLGLEANLIMASNSNFKRKEAKIIIDDIKRYC